MELKSNAIYRVKTVNGTGWFFVPEYPQGSAFITNKECLTQLKEFCAKKETAGYIITSLVELCTSNSATPRIPFRDKEYRAMVERLRKTRGSEPWLMPGTDCVFFFRCRTPGMNNTSARAHKFVELNGRACTVMEQIQERDFCGSEPWSYVMDHGGLYGVCFDGEEEDYAVYGEELTPMKNCIAVIPGFYRRADVFCLHGKKALPTGGPIYRLQEENVDGCGGIAYAYVSFAQNLDAQREELLHQTLKFVKQKSEDADTNEMICMALEKFHLQTGIACSMCDSPLAGVISF